jgi:putative membrane protein
MINLIQGMIIGVANVIPGVSGGTLALIMGIYENLMEAIGEFFVADKKQKLKYGFFLSKILIGAVIGIFLFAKTIEYLYNNYFQPTNFFFIGLIIASIPGITRGEERITDKKGNLVLFLVGFCLIFMLSSIHHGDKSGIGALALDITPLYSLKLLFCGALASAAMIIPGISGSMLLMVLGEYYNVLGLINSRNLVGIGVVGLGAMVGILLFSRIIDFLLKNHRGMTIYFIVGLIVASLVEIWPGINLDKFNLMVNLLSFGLGVSLVLIMFRMEKRGKRVV